MPASAATAAAVNEASAKPRPKVARKRVRKAPPPPAKKEQVEKTEKVEKIEVEKTEEEKVKTEEEKVKTEEEKVEKTEEESERKEMGDAKKEEEGAVPVAAEEEAKVWTCKKNDGKRWHCQRPVSRPNALCDYHFEQKRSYYNPAYDSPSEVAAAPVTAASSAPPLAAVKTSKSSSKHPTSSRASRPSTGSKPRRKRVTVDSGEGFYYYTGFGPFRSKRNCRSSGMQEPAHVAVEQEEPEDIDDAAAPSAGKADQSNDDTDHRPASAPQPVVAPVQVYESSSDDDIAGIAGGDEESSDDGRVFNGKSGQRASANGADSKRNKCQVKKRYRKPVKARSLKSLM